MTDREYAIKSMKEMTVAQMRLSEERLHRHDAEVKKMLTYYKKLIALNRVVLEELEQECQEKINEDMAYALNYLNKYDYRLNVGKLQGEMNQLMLVYGLSDMIYRALTLLKYYTRDGVLWSDILYGYYCNNSRKLDDELQQELGLSRSSYYREKKNAMAYFGYFFFEVVVPQAKGKRFKPSFSLDEEE